MTYQETLEYLYANLPMFQRIGAAAYQKDLTNTRTLCGIAGNPQHQFKSVHVAGTNGKGSTSHMLASVLQSAGYTTGLYTSPHLKSFTERIKVNGQEIEEQFVVSFVERMKPHIETIKPSFFEITVAMAFEYFAFKKVDVAVIETGLGGRLDSTNVIQPIVSVITNIGYDHMDLLGNTLEKIAQEKAGIIKSNTPVVVSETQSELERVFQRAAEANNAQLTFADSKVQCTKMADGRIACLNGNTEFKINLPLPGIYQLKNLPGVMATVDTLRALGFNISDEQLIHGLENVINQTGLKGRWQQLGSNPLIICDTGHNVDGIRIIMEQIKTYSYQKLYIVWGMVTDKERKKIFELLPKDAHYFFCQAKIPRALQAEQLANEAAAFNLEGEVTSDVNEAIAEAKKRATPNDFIFIGGSTFTVAEIDGL
ncbi:MAG: bifunctional folylpolyglutamate synthase/dihydrofolate synthase [Cyclobacteriaceae bacterium]|nr:bifunctional folylpolyglutamate synthase/dihydrofolate synthase [Cyclobacteriaceae bacterium]